MKRRVFLLLAFAVLAAEIITLIVFALKTPYALQDAVAVNEVVQSVTQDFYDIKEHKNCSALEYVVLDGDQKVIYRTGEGLSESLNAAVIHRDTILDVLDNGKAVGKVIIYNDGANALQRQKRNVTVVMSVAISIECLICLGYSLFLHFTIIKPFNKLKGFAERVAGGNLDIPLEMDRQNLFGAFTESFDIMRAELKRARLAEAQAQSSKKELVAKLSHDIKTPVASIKALSEVGLALADKPKDRENYAQIVNKTDQINALVTNLFTATLEELQQLTVTPVNTESRAVLKLLENADYLRRAKLPDVPDCLINADIMRLQQVFDNIFANSYKYADTAITVAARKGENDFSVVIEDFGGGVPWEEVAVLKEKFKRGGNSANIDGAGLGLYISDYFMREMGGSLQVENGEYGLKVTVTLVLSGKI